MTDRRMLTIALGFCFTLAAPCLAAPEAINWRNDIRSAAREAQSNRKPLLLEFSTDWCGYCKKMDRETFSDVNVARHVESCFVPVKIDGESHRELADRLAVRSFPTTVILSPEEHTIVARIKGFRTPKQFRRDLKDICDHAHSPTMDRSQLPLTTFFQDQCPVTLRDEQRFVAGNPAVAVELHGARVVFQTEDHKAKFLRNPNRYWPIADGHCVVSAVAQQRSVIGRVEHAIAYRGRVWLFASAQHAEAFRAKPSRYEEPYATLDQSTTYRR